MPTFSLPEFLKDPPNYLKTLSADEIVAFLEKANEHYYNTNESLVSDDMFDWIKDYVRKNYPKHPFLKTVGAPVENKVELPEWMGSLDKIRDDPKALTSWKSKYAAPYVISDKLDGISGMFSVTKSKQVQLFTRGDGFYGQNVSSILPFIQKDAPDIASIFKKKEYPLLVRGEFIISKAGWEKIKHRGANARNVTAGLLHAKTPDQEIGKQLDFVAYELVEPKMPFYKGLEFVEKLGFTTVFHRMLDPEEMTNDKLSEYLIQRRKDSLYEIDGIVIRDDAQHNIVKGKNPKYAFAYKTILTHEEAEVLVYQVEWNVSKDGMLKPIVHFNPVVINGAKIQKASGFNAAFIEANKIGPGSKIVIIRSGDVIPHILRTITPSQTGKPSMPDMKYEWTDTHVDIRIKMEEENDQMKLRQLEHFVKTLEIKFVAEGVLKKMFEKGIDTIPKFLALDKKDILLLEGVQEKGAEKIYQSIQHSYKNTNCAQLMVASNLFGRGFGEKRVKAILEQNPEILDQVLIKKLHPVEGIGAVTEKQFLENLPKFYEFLASIHFTCKKALPPVAKATGKQVEKVFEGMAVIFTGFRNKDWETKIEELGGKISSGVSKKTSLVVAADVEEESGKVSKAKELGVNLISKEQFEKKYKKYGF
jgi:NAD-dependent DNA ligase